MSAALAAAIVRNRPAIGSRHTYSVTFRQGAKLHTHTHGASELRDRWALLGEVLKARGV